MILGWELQPCHHKTSGSEQVLPLSLFTPELQHDWHCELQTWLFSHFTTELRVTKDGTLPFDPQRIAEGILEGVQNPPVNYPSQRGEFRKNLFYLCRKGSLLTHAQCQMLQRRRGDLT